MSIVYLARIEDRKDPTDYEKFPNVQFHKPLKINLEKNINKCISFNLQVMLKEDYVF
jgi:hypothetical protein